jgi:hypothetical protein
MSILVVGVTFNFFIQKMHVMKLLHFTLIYQKDKYGNRKLWRCTEMEAKIPDTVHEFHSVCIPRINILIIDQCNCKDSAAQIILVRSLIINN